MQPTLLGHFQTQLPIWASPAHVSAILHESNGIPLACDLLPELGVFWVAGRQGILGDSEIMKILVGCSQASEGWPWCNMRKRG